MNQNKINTHNKMSLNEIYEIIPDIANSLYNLRKNGEIPFTNYEALTKINKEMERAVRYTISDVIAIEQFFNSDMR